MKIFITLDTNNGVSFNNRRQSRDAEINTIIHNVIQDNILHCKEYSNSLFSLTDIKTSNKLPKNNSYYFSELEDIKTYEDDIDELYVFYWNRTYPSDVKCTIDFTKFKNVAEVDFEGFSHDKITFVKYMRAPKNE